MREKLLLGAICMAIGLLCSAQNEMVGDAYALPYTAGFSQGWTGTPNAVITDDSVTLTTDYDTVYSPWFVADGEGSVFATVTCSGRLGWSGLCCIMQGEDGNEYRRYLYPSNFEMGYLLEMPTSGGRFRLAFCYDWHSEGDSVYITGLEMFHYYIVASISGPDTIEPGVPAVYTVTAEGDQINDFSFDVYGSNVEWEQDSNTVTVTGHTSGDAIYVYAYIYAGEDSSIAISRYKYIAVRDTTTYLCPDLVEPAPYVADFSQCWTLIGGAEMQDDGSIKLSALGQKAVSPWISTTEDATTYLNYTLLRDNPDGLADDATLANGVELRLFMRTIDDDGLSSFAYCSNPVNTTQMSMDWLNGKTFRLEYEYTYGEEPVYLSAATAYQYGISVSSIVGPDTVYTDEAASLSVEYSLGDGEEPDDVSWYIAGASVTGVNTLTPTATWSNAGRYYVSLQISKYIPSIGTTLYADAYKYVTVLERPIDCDTAVYTLPYTSNFNKCWETGGNATITNANKATLTAYGDTLRSPWIYIDADTVTLGFNIEPTDYNYEYYQYCRVDIADSTGVIDSNVVWVPSYYEKTTLTGLAGRTVRFEFSHYLDGEGTGFVVNRIALFTDKITASIQGPDTVVMGQPATFTAEVSPSDNVNLSWWSSETGNGHSSTYNAQWNSPGRNTVSLYASTSLYGFSMSVNKTHTVVVLPSDSLLAATVQLPYTANFAEGWELSGGATLTDDGRIRLDSLGQKAVSPWIYTGDNGNLVWHFLMERQDNGNYEYGTFLDSIHYSSKAETYGDGYIFNPYYNFIPYAYQMQKYDGLSFSNGYLGCVMRFIVEYDDSVSTEPLFVGGFDMYRSVVDMNIVGPDTVYAGQQTHYSLQHGIVHHWGQPEPAEEPSTPSISWSAWGTAGTPSDYTWISAPSSDSVVIVFNTPGRYEIQGRKYYSSFYNSMSSDNYVYRYITVLEMPDSTQPNPCDTVVYTLPYTADFTQCWQTSLGAVISDATHVTMPFNGATITSPLLHCDSNTYLHYRVEYNEEVEPATEFCINTEMKLYDENGEFVKYVYGNNKLNVPEGNYRVSIRYNNDCIHIASVSIVDFWADEYIKPDVVFSTLPDTMYTYDTVKLTYTVTGDTDSATVEWNMGSSYTTNADTLYLWRASIGTPFWINFYASVRIITRHHGTFYYSSNSQKITFVDRPCPDVVRQFPYVQDFERGWQCWSFETTEGDGLSNSLVSASSYMGGYYPPQQGDNYAYFGSSNTANDGMFVSPQFDFGNAYHSMTFYAHGYSSSVSSTTTLRVLYGTEDDTNSMDFLLASGNNWMLFEVLLRPNTTFVGFAPVSGPSGMVSIDNIVITPLGIAADSTVTIVDTVRTDTVVYNITYQDSVEYNITVQDSVEYNITVQDSVEYNITLQDSVEYNITVQDSVVYNITVQDSVEYNITVQDSVVWNIVQSDSVVYYYDTTCATHDTLTIYEFLHDTTVITDTLVLTLYDTVYIHDTIYIHDTVYVGVDEVDAINAKIYINLGQIVVEGADGNNVRLYDVNGRMLATRQDEYTPLRFDVPASGAYLVKIGNLQARKVVVVR